MQGVIKSRADGLWIGPMLAGMVGATAVAALWALAIEVPVADILKTAVGPGFGALAGAYLAFQVQTRQKEHEKRHAQVAALREVQFAVHARWVILMTFHKSQLLPHKDKPDRFLRIGLLPFNKDSIAPAIKFDHLGFLLEGRRPFLLEKVHGVDFAFGMACDAITRWYLCSDECKRAHISNEAELQKWHRMLANHADAVYRAVPGILGDLKSAYDDLIAEMPERFPGDVSFSSNITHFETSGV